VVYNISKRLLQIILSLWFGFRVDGAAHEPTAGPVVIVSNHVSDLDPLIVGAALKRRVSFMAKQELFRPPAIRWWVSACGAFPVRRGEPDRQALRTALRVLEGGGALVMFPEGTRGTSRELRPPEPGAALLALRTGATVLPVAVLGSNEVLPRGARRMRRATIAVRIGEPIPVSRPGQARAGGKRDREEIDALGRRFMGAIAQLMAAPRPRHPDGAPV
jgi:1-acyl-sn-glycerol-3-phosphate acyltransferase